jgi:hypothetical protein
VTADGSGRRVDEATLRYLAGVLASQSEVSGTSLFPEHRAETLVVSMDDRYYPDPIGSVRLEVRLYTNGEFHVSYVESYLGALRQCRWDRHEQDHSARDHWHPLPSASTADAEDRSFPPGLVATIETVVLPWLEERLGELRNELD